MEAFIKKTQKDLTTPKVCFVIDLVHCIIKIYYERNKHIKDDKRSDNDKRKIKVFIEIQEGEKELYYICKLENFKKAWKALMTLKVRFEQLLQVQYGRVILSNLFLVCYILGSSKRYVKFYSG